MHLVRDRRRHDPGGTIQPVPRRRRLTTSETVREGPGSANYTFGQSAVDDAAGTVNVRRGRAKVTLG